VADHRVRPGSYGGRVISRDVVVLRSVVSRRAASRSGWDAVSLYRSVFAAMVPALSSCEESVNAEPKG